MTPHSYQLLVSEDGDTFGGSPAASHTHRKKREMCCLHTATPGILAHDPVVLGGHFSHRIPLQGGAWAVPRVCFPVPHILVSASISGTAFLYDGIVVTFFLSGKVTVSITLKGSVVNPHWIRAKISCGAFRLELDVSI